MADKNCQVCGGPVKNGRCVLCGMPNKRDEVLYHLNENREEHYKHATEKAREILKSRELPRADQGNTQKADASAQKAKAAPEKGKPAKTVQPETKKTPVKGMQPESRKGPVKAEKKKFRGIRILMVFLLAGIAFAVVDREESGLSHRVERTGKGLALEIYEISPERSLVVGEDLPAGTYTAVLEEGIATLSLKYEGEASQWNFKDGQREMELAVSDGVLISLYNTDLADRTLMLTRFIPEE